MPARIARLCCFTAAAVYNRGPQLQQQRKCQTAIVANVVCTITHMQQAAAIGRKVVAWSDDRSQAPIKPLTTVVQRGSATHAWCCLLLVLGGGVVMSSQVGVSTLSVCCCYYLLCGLCSSRKTQKKNLNWYVRMKMNKASHRTPGNRLTYSRRQNLERPATRSTLLGLRPDLDDRVRTAFPYR